MRRIAITGHRALNRDTTRLVRRHIGWALARERLPVVGLSCLAEGADQIFAQLVLKAGGSLEAFLAAERFAETLTGESRSYYQTLRRLAGAVHTVPRRDPSPESYMQAGRMMVRRADALWAVWDGEPARGYGGTADVVAYARARGVPVTVIWPDGAVNQSAVNGNSAREVAGR